MKFLKNVLPFIMGIVFIAVGVFSFINQNRLNNVCTEQVVGTVVEIIQESSYDSESNTTSYTYYPVVEYTAGSERVTERGSVGSNPSKYKVGDNVDILYNPSNISEFIISGDSTSMILSIVFAVAGVVLLIAGVVTFIRKS